MTELWVVQLICIYINFSEPDDSKESSTSSATSPPSITPLVAKEHFVFTDPEGQLYHFSVEGNTIKDGTKVPAETSLGKMSQKTRREELKIISPSFHQLCFFFSRHNHLHRVEEWPHCPRRHGWTYQRLGCQNPNVPKHCHEQGDDQEDEICPGAR